MKTRIHPNRALLLAGNTVVMTILSLAALSFAGAAHARDNVTLSVGIGVPGVLVGATNAYPVYSQPQPVYVQPAPVYYQQAPVYYSRPPVYAVPQPVYYGRPPGWYGRHHKHRHDDDDRDERRGGYYQQSPYGYGQVYYRR